METDIAALELLVEEPAERPVLALWPCTHTSRTCNPYATTH